jgi:hypothetical protein
MKQAQKVQSLEDYLDSCTTKSWGAWFCGAMAKRVPIFSRTESGTLISLEVITAESLHLLQKLEEILDPGIHFLYVSHF